MFRSVVGVPQRNGVSIKALTPTLATLLLLPCGSSAQNTAPILHYRMVHTIPDDFDDRVRRVITEADGIDAVAIVLELDVWEGDLEAAQRGVTVLLDSHHPVYAYVSGVALELGALVALAADSIFMAPDARLGGSPNAEEFQNRSATTRLRTLRSELRNVAMRRGLRPEIAEAMADPDVRIDGLHEPGRVLTIDAQAAEQLGIATKIATLEALTERIGATAEDQDDIDLVTASAEGVVGTTIDIDNQSWRDIRIFVVRGSSRRRLGMATSMSKRRFFVPYAELSGGRGIRLMASPVGDNETVTTELIRSYGGVVIQWRLLNQLAQSSLFIFRP